MAEYIKNGIIINNNTAAAATVTATLTAPPAGMVNKILWIACFAAAATAADVQVQRNDGTVLARVGGAGIGIIGTTLTFAGSSQQPTHGLPNDTAADATKVVLTTTAGTATQVTVGYINVPA